MRRKVIAWALCSGLAVSLIACCTLLFRYDKSPRVIEVDNSSDGQYRAEVLNAPDSSINTVRFTDASGHLLVNGEFAEENAGIIWDDHAFTVWWGASSTAVRCGICAGDQVIRLPVTSDDELATLQKFGRFKELSIDGDCVFAETSLQRLRSMLWLRKLSLFGDLFSGKSIATIGPLPGLEQLELSGSNFDDAALAAIQGCTNLKVVQLYNTAVTQKGVDALHAGYPKLQIRIAENRPRPAIPHGY